MKNLIRCTRFMVLYGFLLYAFSCVLYAQNPSKHFKDIFERETSQNRQESQYGKFRYITNLSFFPDTLPLWFFNPPQSDRESVYAIGISDPDLSPREAFHQAYGRAMVMAVLYNAPRIEYYRDAFTSAGDENPQQGYRHRFDTYFRITSTEVADSSQFWLIDNHLTRYNESIVLIGYTPQTTSTVENQTSGISATASVLYIEAHINDVYEPQASFDLSSGILFNGEMTANSEFNCTRKGNRTSTLSIHNGKRNNFPMFVYRYSNPMAEPYTMPLVSYHGLWGLFLPQLLEHLTLTTEQTNLHIRTLEEQTQPRIQDITREVAALTARIHLQRVDFNADKILFETSLEKIR